MFTKKNNEFQKERNLSKPPPIIKAKTTQILQIIYLQRVDTITVGVQIVHQIHDC